MLLTEKKNANLCFCALHVGRLSSERQGTPPMLCGDVYGLPIEATVITPREKNVHKNWPVLTTEMMVQLFVLLLRNQCIAAFCGPSLAWDETGRC